MSRKRPLPPLDFDTTLEDEIINNSQRKKSSPGPDLENSLAKHDYDSDSSLDIINTSMYDVSNEEDKSKKKKMRQKKKLKYEALDVIWVKHGRNYPSWPFWISSVRGKRLIGLYICHNEFNREEKEFSFPVNSKKISSFTLYTKPFVAAARAIYERQNMIGSKEFENFNDAVELAEMYVIHHGKGGILDSKREGYEFFRSRGRAHYGRLMEGLTERSSTIGYPPTPPSPPQNAPEVPVASSASAASDPPQDQDPIPHKVEEEPTSSVDRLTPYKRNLERRDKRYKTKAKLGVEAFNKRNEDLVTFIVQGHCDQHLLDICRMNIVSNRMDNFLADWSKAPRTNISCPLPQGELYFESSEQNHKITKYLIEFTTQLEEFASFTNSSTLDRIKRKEFIMKVLIPESIIFSIIKCFRRSEKCANEMFVKGYTGPRLTPPALDRQLTEEERRSCEIRVEELRRELGW